MKKNAPYELPEDFSRRIGLTFNNELLLYRALTHRSFLSTHVWSAMPPAEKQLS